MLDLDDYKKARVFCRTNRIAQIVLSVAFVIALNFLAAHFFFRKDITHQNKYSLSPETLAYLRAIDEPIDVFVTFSPHSEDATAREVFEYINNLLREYSYAARTASEDMIRVSYIDLYSQRKKAEALAAKYNLKRQNSVLLVSGDRQYQILDTDLYEAENGQVIGFKGEQELTSAILSVTQAKRPKIYFTKGHGEMSPKEVSPVRGLSQLASFLKKRNFDVEILDLSLVGQIPEDADLVVVASPQTPFLPFEVNKLGNYLDEEQGTLVAFIDPARSHGLDELLFDWGIVSDDLVVVEIGKEFQDAGGDMIVRRFAEHPINQLLIDYRITLLAGLSRPVRPDLGAPLSETLTVTPLMLSSDQSWGERDYLVSRVPLYEKGKDLRGPVSLAVLAEKKPASHLGVSLPAGRFLVFGNSDVIANQKFNLLGNEILVMDILNWALDRDSLLSIAPQPLDFYQISLSQRDLFKLFAFLLMLPCFVAIIGIVMHFKRRR